MKIYENALKIIPGITSFDKQDTKFVYQSDGNMYARIVFNRGNEKCFAHMKIDNEYTMYD